MNNSQIKNNKQSNGIKMYCILMLILFIGYMAWTAYTATSNTRRIFGEVKERTEKARLILKGIEGVAHLMNIHNVSESISNKINVSNSDISNFLHSVENFAHFLNNDDAVLDNDLLLKDSIDDSIFMNDTID